MMDWIGPCLVVLVLIGCVFVLYRLAFNHGYEVAVKQAFKPTATVKYAGSSGTLAANSLATKAVSPCGECGSDPHHPQCPKANEQLKPLRRNWKGFSRIKRELESKPESA